MKRSKFNSKPSRRDFLKTGAAALGSIPLARASMQASPQSAAAEIHVENVILIISDTLRRDTLSCYGGDWVHTPHLDRFAQRTVVFDNAYLSSFPTVLLRNDILTGRYTFTYKPWAPLGSDEITLQETLGDAGILTSLVVDTPHPFAPGYNYQRGFNAWQLIRGQEHDPFRTAPREVKFPCAPSKLRLGEETVGQYLRNVARRTREEDYFVARTMTRAAEWLEENRDGRRFFLYVDTFDPHEPWDPPRYYVERYDPDYEGEEVIYPRYDLWREFLSESELRHCRALYAGEATLVDRWVGFLLDRIETLGLLENTAVIFVSDHGFYLGEHGYIGKSLLRGDAYQSLPLYPEIVRIPMMVHYPGCRGGARLQALAQPVDLTGTVLDLLRVTKPASIEGASLVPLLEGRTSKAKEIAIGSPTLFQNAETPPSPADRSSITDGEWLLIFGCHLGETAREQYTASVDSIVRKVKELQGEIHPELYNLKRDPKCEKNLFSSEHAVAERLHAAYIEFLESRKYPPKRLELFRHLEGG
jgi:arylsulfatase A-like enzyme